MGRYSCAANREIPRRRLASKPNPDLIILPQNVWRPAHAFPPLPTLHNIQPRKNPARTVSRSNGTRTGADDISEPWPSTCPAPSTSSRQPRVTRHRPTDRLVQKVHHPRASCSHGTGHPRHWRSRPRRCCLTRRRERGQQGRRAIRRARGPRAAAAAGRRARVAWPAPRRCLLMQAAGEERDVHGRGRAGDASDRQRGSHGVRQRLETGVGRDQEQVRGDHGRHRCHARNVERRCCRIGDR